MWVKSMITTRFLRSPLVLALGAGLLASPTVFAADYCDQLTIDRTPAKADSAKLSSLSSWWVKPRSHPELSDYRPASPLLLSEAEATHPVLASGDRFYTLHGGVRSADESLTTVAPTLTYQWTAEPKAYLPEGPTFGDIGAYFAPLLTFPDSELDYSVGAVSLEDGHRLWRAMPGQYGQGGAPLVMPSPEVGEKMVYSGGAEAVFAISESGAVQWCSSTGQAGGDPVADLVGSIDNHLYGINYDPITDSVIALYGTGNVVAFDRVTGQRLTNFVLPGAPAPDSSGIVVPDLFKEGGEEAMLDQFVPDGYQLPEGFSLLDSLIAAVLGGSGKVNNYYAIDPDHGHLWIAATLEDEADGTVDGLADFGALYRVDPQRNGDQMSMTIGCRIPFDGGSASTPAIKPGGDRIYTSDSFGVVLAYDRQCNPLWSLDLGEQVVGSVGVSSTDNNLYAATGKSVYRMVDEGDHGRLVWSADIASAFAGSTTLRTILEPLKAALGNLGLKAPVSFNAANMNLAGISENAIMIQAAYGLQIDPDNSLMFGPTSVAMVTIDKLNGKVLNATPAREETVSVMAIAQNGDKYISNSPLRRVFVRGLVQKLALFDGSYMADWAVPPLSGGVSRYAGVSDFDLAARDNACFAERRLAVWNATGKAGFGIGPEGLLVPLMADKALANADKALAAGEMGWLQYARVRPRLARATSELAAGDLRAAQSYLGQACSLLD